MEGDRREVSLSPKCPVVMSQASLDGGGQTGSFPFSELSSHYEPSESCETNIRKRPVCPRVPPSSPEFPKGAPPASASVVVILGFFSKAFEILFDVRRWVKIFGVNEAIVVIRRKIRSSAVLAPNSRNVQFCISLQLQAASWARKQSRGHRLSDPNQTILMKYFLRSERLTLNSGHRSARRTGDSVMSLA